MLMNVNIIIFIIVNMGKNINFEEIIKTKYMELEYIKVNGICYSPQKAGVKDKYKKFANYPVCTIKKLWFGFWQIDYYCEYTAWKKGYVQDGEENYPNKRIILSPLHIQEISYKL